MPDIANPHTINYLPQTDKTYHSRRSWNCSRVPSLPFSKAGVSCIENPHHHELLPSFVAKKKQKKTGTPSTVSNFYFDAALSPASSCSLATLNFALYHTVRCRRGVEGGGTEGARQARIRRVVLIGTVRHAPRVLYSLSKKCYYYSRAHHCLLFVRENIMRKHTHTHAHCFLFFSFSRFLCESDISPPKLRSSATLLYY